MLPKTKRFERELKDGNGNKFLAVMTVLEDGPVFEKALVTLARKARSGPRQQAKILGGLIHVIVHPVKL